MSESKEVKAQPPEYRICWFNLLGLFSRFVLTHASNMCVYVIFRATILAGINLAVILSLCSLAVFFTAFVFRLLFQEHLFCKHLVGMLLLVVAGVIISTSEKPKLLGNCSGLGNPSGTVSTGNLGSRTYPGPLQAVWNNWCALMVISLTKISLEGSSLIVK